MPWVHVCPTLAILRTGIIREDHNECVGICRGLGIRILRFDYQSGRLKTNLWHNSIQHVSRFFNLLLMFKESTLDSNWGPRVGVLVLLEVAQPFVIHPLFSVRHLFFSSSKSLRKYKTNEIGFCYTWQYIVGVGQWQSECLKIPKYFEIICWRVLVQCLSIPSASDSQS
jgi:hypothetical protein